MAAFGRFSVRFLRTARLVKARNDTSDTHNAATTRRRLVVREVQEGSSEGDRETDGGRGGGAVWVRGLEAVCCWQQCCC